MHAMLIHNLWIIEQIYSNTKHLEFSVVLLLWIYQIQLEKMSEIPSGKDQKFALATYIFLYELLLSSIK